MKSLTDLQKLRYDKARDYGDSCCQSRDELWWMRTRDFQAGFDACQSEMQQQLEDAKLDFKRVYEINSKLKGLVEKMKAALEKIEARNIKENFIDGLDSNSSLVLSMYATMTLAEVERIEKGLR